MRLIFSFAFFIVFSFAASGQKILIFKNGQTKAFKKWKLGNENVQIVDDNGVKSVIDVAKIDGYFDVWYKIRVCTRPSASHGFLR